MMEGYQSTGSDSGMWGAISQAIGAWSAREVAQEETKQSQADQLATPYRYNNPQALAAPKDNTMTYIAVGAVALVAVIGVIVALRA